MNEIRIDSNGYGISNVYKSNAICDDGIIVYDRDLENVQIHDFARLIFENKIIGSLTHIGYSHFAKEFLIYYKINKKILLSHKVILFPEKYLLFPVIDATIIICPQCQLSFIVGSEPCKCILGANYIIPSGITVVDTIITDEIDDNISNKKRLLRKFFGGAIAYLNFEEDNDSE